MKKLNLETIRKLIRNEVRAIVDEDALMDPPELGEPHFIPRDEYEDDVDQCPTCGDYHDQCPTCGMRHHDQGCAPQQSSLFLTEACPHTEDDDGMDDYSLSSMRKNDLSSIFDKIAGISHIPHEEGEKQAISGLGDFSNLSHTNIDHDEAFSAGCSVCGGHGGQCDHHNDSGRNLSYGDVKSSDREGRMSKKHLSYISRKTQSLHDLLNDDDDLPEWVQSKISRAAEKVQTVYDYLEHELKNEEH
jgi:hypothetical protein